MKKQFAIFLIVCLVNTYIAYLIWTNKDFILLRPFQKEITFDNVYKVHADDFRNTYVISDSKQNLKKFDSAGKLVYHLRPHIAEERLYPQFTDMVSDSKGNLYVLMSHMDINGLIIKMEEILRYTPDGQLDSSWAPYYVLHETQKDSLRENYFQSIQVQNDNLQLITVKDFTVNVQTISAEDGKTNVLATVKLPAETYISSISSSADGSLIWATTKKGELIQIKGTSGRGSVSALYPEALHISGEWGYFMEQYGDSVKRFRLQAPDTTETIISVKALNQQMNIDDTLSDFSMAPNGQLILGLSDRIVRMSDERNLTTLTYSDSMLRLQYLFWLGGAAMLVLAVYALYILYVRIMPYSLIYKQLFIFIPFILGMLLFLSFFVFNKFSVDMDYEAKRQLIFVAHDGQNLLDGALLEQLHSPAQFMNDTYKSLRNKITFEDQFGKFYISAYKLNGNKLYHVLEDDSQFRMMDSFEVDSFADSGLLNCSIRNAEGEWIEIDSYKPIIEQKQYAACVSEDGEGQWMYALGPLFNADKTKVIGMYETGINTYAFDKRKDEDMLLIMRVILIIAVSLIVLYFFVTMTQLTPIRRLKHSVDAIAGKDLDARVTIRSKDEVAQLGERFNLMADNLKKYVEDIQLLSQSYFRFVPQQFLDFLGRSQIMEVHLGDQTEKDMTILVTNLRNFSQLFHKLDLNPEQSFQYVNLFLEQCCPHIRNTDGFIGKYMGSGILALYAGDPGNAIRAAIGMNHTLHAWNKAHPDSNMPIHIGTGIHKGTLMLGVIGEDERLDTGIISDDVNMSSKLEALSEKLGVSILVSGVAFDTLAHRPFEYRTLGLIQIEGMAKPMEMYDVFDGDPEPIRALKRSTKKLFEDAVMMYRQARFSDARSAFLEVIRQNQWDKAAKLYFYHCDDYFMKGPGEEWDGEISA